MAELGWSRNRAARDAGDVAADASRVTWERWLLREEAPRARLLLGFLIPVSLLFLIGDLRFEGAERTLYVGARIGYVSLCLLALVALHRFARPRRVWAACGAGAMGLALFLCLRYLRGDGFAGLIGHLPSDVLVVLAIYMIPHYLAVQIVATLLVCAASIYDYVVWKGAGGPELALLLATLAFAQLLGAGGALAFRRELRERYEALSELQDLRSSIPLCAWCHKIRDDAGSWQRLERYLETHADMAFTHGVCPDCYARMERGAAPS